MRETPPNEGQRTVDFFEQVLVHTKGRWAGRPFLLPSWQQNDIVRPLFGTLVPNPNPESPRKWLRQYRTAYVELARKNGKSEIGAGIALKLLTADAEEGAEIYSAAADRDQASLVFNVAAQMVYRQPLLNSRLKVIESTKRIIDPVTGSVYRAIAADAAGSHGFNASGIIFDELHAQPTRELWDVLTTSTAAREQPLIFAITTAGYDRQSICWELHEYATKVLSGVVEDPTFFAYIRALPEDMDWTDEKNWKIANPALDDFRSRDELRTMVNRAKETPALQNTVRRLYFSQWTGSETRWFDLGVWDKCGGEVDIESLAGQTCYGGLDLSSTSDFSAWVLWFPEQETLLCRFFLPRAALEKRTAMRPQLEAWEREGLLYVTPGDVIDYDFIEAQVLRDAEAYTLEEVGYDPWAATQLAVHLQEELGDGVMVPVRQGFGTLSAPAKLLETLVANGTFNHGGNPILRWMADCVMVDQDANGNIKPSRKKSTERIDGIAATLNALERAMHATTSPDVLLYVAGEEDE